MEMKTKKQFYYRVEEGQNLKDICAMFNTCKENILRNNNEIELYAGEWVRITKNDFFMHIVKPTETLPLIANMYNIDINKLKEDNNLNSEKLFIGQMLKIK